MKANQESRELVTKLMKDLESINDSLLSSEHLQKASTEEVHATTLIINRNNRIIEMLKQEVS